jgi:luxS protein involved in autoinducer AI2 synthesis
VQCGWGANHSLEAAQQAVSQFLAQRAVWGQVMAQAADEPEVPAVEAQAPVSEAQAAATEPAN